MKNKLHMIFILAFFMGLASGWVLRGFHILGWPNRISYAPQKISASDVRKNELYGPPSEKTPRAPRPTPNPIQIKH